MIVNQNRLSILTQSEIQDYFGIPRLTQEDREYYFELADNEVKLISENWPLNSKLYFVLQLGYFKARRMFFSFDIEAVANDVSYIIEMYFPYDANHEFKVPSKQTRVNQQKIICQHFSFRRYDKHAGAELKDIARRIVRRSAKPIYILRELLSHLDKQRVAPPAYSTFQDLIGRCLSEERQRIGERLTRDLVPDIEAGLSDILFNDSTGLHWVTQLKKEPRDFSYKEVLSETMRARQLKPLYDFCVHWLPNIEISNESIRYYAALVEYYSVYKLRRFDTSTAYFYLLCYAYHRTHIIHDNLIDALIYNVRHYEEQAKCNARELIYRQTSRASEDIKMTGKILEFFLSPDIDDCLSFGEIRERAFELLAREKMVNVTTFINSTGFDEEEYQWQHLESLSGSIKRNLRQIIRAIDFNSHGEEAPLIEAITFLQLNFEQGRILRRLPKANFPTSFLTNALKKYVYTDATPVSLMAERYEFAVYKMLRKAFESGDIFNHKTNKYRSFTDYLIPLNRWSKHKEKILNELDLPILTTPIQQTLNEFKITLEEKLQHVNQRILDRENKDIKITGQGERVKWTLPYKRDEEEENHRFYHSVPIIGIASLLSYVHRKTGFLDGFSHVLDRYVKGTKDEKTLLACIVALGTNMSLGRMGEISDVDVQELQTTYRNFFRLESLKETNDLIANATAKLSIFRHYDIETDVLHSSSDGQRFETQRNTFNARHASKYFGLKKGISALTLIGNHVPINAKVIGTHEHESYFVFDLLYNNTTDIDPDRHSVDTHGTNQVNFWILHAFGYQFAPRYRNFSSKTDSIVGFQFPGYYADEFLVKPARKVNENLIIKEWPNIQHIMASLGQKETTQSAIVRKLSSYARQNKTKKALWELDNICRSIYLLNYLDDRLLRKHVTKALNRGEAYHRLKKAIAHVNGGKLRVKSEIEQHIIHECTRLIANAIIYFNAELLSGFIDGKSSGSTLTAQHVKKISPVAWQHINFYGRFEFNDLGTPFDVDEFMKMLDLAELNTILEPVN
jgi:TnpA family transposase